MFYQTCREAKAEDLNVFLLIESLYSYPGFVPLDHV